MLEKTPEYFYRTIGNERSNNFTDRMQNLLVESWLIVLKQNETAK
jgi:hypothetical protein